MGKIIGIDLGTTNSCVSVFEGNEPVVIANSEGKRTTPSIVAFVDGGERKVGDPAKRQAITNPKRTIFSIKRFMGENWDQVQKEVARVPYKVVKGDNNTPRVDIDGRLYTPQEISAMILQKMKKTAEDYLGQEIITSDGTTLLGADDKAGVCAIVSACEYLLAHPEIKHGKILLAFTPDEEIGRGTEHFPLTDFSADFAYTVDGGAVGELNYETFNACNAKVTIYGVSVHPGSAKNKMRNAVTMAAKWQMLLPAGERPEYTELYEGFYHSLRINGGTDKVELEMILRDHDRKKLEDRKKLLLHMVDCLNAEYGAGSVVCKMEDVYCNMKEYIMPVYEIIERAENAMRAAGIEPHLVPVRGGTDGARLSEMGLPCPNIFTGGHNFHGRFEYLPVPSLLKCVEVLVKLVQK